MLVLVFKNLREMSVRLKIFSCKWRPTLLLNALRCTDKELCESEIYNNDKINKVVIILKKDISVNYSL